MRTCVTTGSFMAESRGRTSLRHNRKRTHRRETPTRIRSRVAQSRAPSRGYVANRVRNRRVIILKVVARIDLSHETNTHVMNSRATSNRGQSRRHRARMNVVNGRRPWGDQNPGTSHDRDRSPDPSHELSHGPNLDLSRDQRRPEENPSELHP